MRVTHDGALTLSLAGGEEAEHAWHTLAEQVRQLPEVQSRACIVAPYRSLNRYYVRVFVHSPDDSTVVRALAKLETGQ